MGEPVRERRPLDELHDQRGDRNAARRLGRRLDDTVYLRDVGMVERRENLGFAAEAREAISIGCDGRVEHLDGDVAIQLQVAGAMDLPHAPGAHNAQDVVVLEAIAGDQSHLRPSLLSVRRQILTPTAPSTQPTTASFNALRPWTKMPRPDDSLS